MVLYPLTQMHSTVILMGRPMNWKVCFTKLHLTFFFFSKIYLSFISDLMVVMSNINLLD